VGRGAAVEWTADMVNSGCIANGLQATGFDARGVTIRNANAVTGIAATTGRGAVVGIIGRMQALPPPYWSVMPGGTRSA